MSSHHIVRDDQEPALILNHPNPDDRVVLQLMEWSPLLVCLPASFSFVEDKQQWVDCFVRYENSGNIPPISIPSATVSIVSNKDADILRYAIDLLVEKGHQVLHIYSDIKNKEMLNLVKEYTEVEIVFFDGEARHIPCLGGEFEKWYPVDQKIKVYPSMDSYNAENWQTLEKEGFLKLVHSDPFLLSEFLNI